MKRSRFGRRSGLPQEAESLLKWAAGLAESGSRAEDVFWEKQLAGVIDHLLSTGKEDVIAATLDHLFTSNNNAYDELADLLEARTESGMGILQHHVEEARDRQTLLIVAPVLAWSRFSIPSGPLPATLVANLRVHLGAHILAKNIQFSIANVLFSPDQLPQGFSETALMAAQLCTSALNNEDVDVPSDVLSETSRYLSDVRYLLIGAVAHSGEPIFRWQEKNGSRDQSTEQWRAQAGACLAPLLAGCSMELILPDAFFAACRHADINSRPYSIRASVAFLSTTLDIPPNKLRAIIAPFYENEIEQYRVSFTQSGNDNIVHGIVWPLLDMEDETVDSVEQIKSILRECGVAEILVIENRLPMEFCDDCGAPLYPTPDGETAHAELPEATAEQMPKHLH